MFVGHGNPVTSGAYACRPSLALVRGARCYGGLMVSCLAQGLAVHAVAASSDTQDAVAHYPESLMSENFSSPESSSLPTLAQIKTYDENRPSFPGEHLFALGAGVALLMASRRSRSFLTRTAGSVLGSALLYRSASGRDGLTKLLRFLPGGFLGRR